MPLWNDPVARAWHLVSRPAQPIAAQLQQAAPDGIDVYFDNVGGDHLEAALESLRVHGRVVLCGMIDGYHSPAGTAAPRDLIQAIDKRLQLTGILVADHADLAAEFVDRGPAGSLTG